MSWRSFRLSVLIIIRTFVTRAVSANILNQRRMIVIALCLVYVVCSVKIFAYMYVLFKVHSLCDEAVYVTELMFLETSALTGENVEETFLQCARSILTKIESGTTACLSQTFMMVSSVFQEPE